MATVKDLSSSTTYFHNFVLPLTSPKQQGHLWLETSRALSCFEVDYFKSFVDSDQHTQRNAFSGSDWGRIFFKESVLGYLKNSGVQDPYPQNLDGEETIQMSTNRKTKKIYSVLGCYLGTKGIKNPHVLPHG